MKVLYAIYDRNDNFITCGFSLKEIGITDMQSYAMQHGLSTRKLKQGDLI